MSDEPTSQRGGTTTSAVAPPVVRTKLSPPVISIAHLPRRDLVESLHAPHRLVVVSAPAGWGKTSLLAAWYMQGSDDRRFVYVRLAADDDRPTTFWNYVIAALQTVYPDGFVEAAGLVRDPRADYLRQIVPAVVNQLAGLDTATTIVLDDYHNLDDERIHHSVIQLVEQLPTTATVAISTRVDPPLPLGRLRASGELLEMRADRLAFDADEAAEFLRTRFDVDLEPEDAAVLRARTEGWPAGLQLAGLSLQHAADHKGFVERFAGDDRNIADYLVGEVLAVLDDERLNFLIRTAPLSELTGPLCDAVLGVDGSAITLEQLEHDGLFTVPLDHQRRWYRYHHLFHDWLRHELRVREPEILPEVHRRAAEWHAVHAAVDTAIDHALAIPDVDRAGELIARYLGDWTNVDWSRLWRWLDHLPDEVVTRHPFVALARSRLDFEQGRFVQALDWIDGVEADATSLPEAHRLTLAHRLQLWRALAQLTHGDMASALQLAEGVAETEREHRSPDYAGAVGLIGMTTFWLIGPLEAIAPLNESSVARAEAGLVDGGVTSLLALAHAEVGDLSTAEGIANRALDLPDPDERNRYPEHMAALYAIGRVRLVRGDRRGAVASITEGLELARSWVEPVFVAYGCLLLAEASDGYVEKRALVREARQLTHGAVRRGRIGELVDAAEKRLAMRRPAAESAGSVLVDTLTERELEVLRLLRTDLSLREIARELHLAHNTVKSYTKSIYRKLGVTSRSAALEVALDLGLV